MGTPRHVALHRMGAATMLVTLLLLSACGVRYDLAINGNETVSLTYETWDSSSLGIVSQSRCTEGKVPGGSLFPSDANVTYTFLSDEEHPTCRVTGHNISIADLNSMGKGVWNITHSDDAYEFTMSPSSLEKLSDDTSLSDVGTDVGAVALQVSVSFPGKVIDSNGTASGNTVTWTEVSKQSEDLSATGSDKAGAPFALISVILVSILFAGAMATATLVTSRRRRRAEKAAVSALIASGYPTADGGEPDLSAQTPGQSSAQFPVQTSMQFSEQLSEPHSAQVLEQQGHSPGYTPYTPGQELQTPASASYQAPQTVPYYPGAAPSAPSAQVWPQAYQAGAAPGAPSAQEAYQPTYQVPLPGQQTSTPYQPPQAPGNSSTYLA